MCPLDSRLYFFTFLHRVSQQSHRMGHCELQVCLIYGLNSIPRALIECVCRVSSLSLSLAQLKVKRNLIGIFLVFAQSGYRKEPHEILWHYFGHIFVDRWSPCIVKITNYFEIERKKEENILFQMFRRGFLLLFG